MISEDYSSRRNFLKKATLGGAALAAAPAWGRVLGANDRINVALIGVGCRGNDHLEPAAPAPGKQTGHRNRGHL